MEQILITESNLIEMQNIIKPKEMIILKFTASWCGPCNAIKPICDEYVNKLPASIYYFEIDVDDSIELYMQLKKYKMLNGIPALFAYKDGKRDHWYVPDDSQLGGDKKKVKEFFERCISYVS